MPNGDYNKMNKDGNAGKGLLGLMGLFAALSAAKSVSNSKKEQKIADLKLQLVNVQYKKSQLKGGFFRELRNAQEIEELESQEAAILSQLKELGG